MVERRLAKDDDTIAVRKLWQYCFDDEDDFIQWYFSDYYLAENTLVIYDEDRLLAALQVIPYQIMMRKQKLSCGYVVGVSTAPEARGQGLSTMMITDALAMMRQRGQVLSLLMPFAGGFYYRYQWQFVYFKQQVTLPIDELRTLSKPYGRLIMIEPFDHLPELQRVYDAFCASRNGHVVRDARNWQHFLTDVALQNGFCVLLYDPSNEPIGYALYTKQNGDINVIEMAYTTYSARGSLLDYFYSHRSHCQRLLWSAPADDCLPYELPASKNVIVWQPYLMLRIVDVIGVLSQLDYPPEETLTLRLKITDNWAEWNNGIFRLQIAAGQATVERMQDEAWDMAMDVGALALFVSGASDIHQLIWRGLVQAKNDDFLQAWQRLWSPQVNWISEEY